MNGLFSPSRHSCRSGSAHTLNPVRRNGRAYSLGTSLLHTRNTQARSRTLRYPHDAAHLRHYRSAPVADLVVAGFYRWSCIPSWQSAFYFSTATYSTVGSGDLLLPVIWRTLGPIESITGVLMCGLSASFLFAIVIRLVARESRFAPEMARHEQRSTPVHPSESEWTERETKR